jgi:peroxiredoxin
MKLNVKYFTLLALSLFLIGGQSAARADVETELKELVGKVQAKISAGKSAVGEFKEDFEAFDALLATYKGDKSDGVASVLLMKSMLYVQILDDTDNGFAELRRLVKEFPGTESAESAAGAIAHFEMQDNLKIGKIFPDFKEKDTDGNDLSISNFKGKVVLVDFWATWCGPCVAELPNVLEAYNDYHEKGFEVVGISLDSAKDKLEQFVKRRKMPWVQYFDGQGWSNKLAQQYGVTSIPATYLLDEGGKIVAKDLRGPALKVEIARLLDSK